jgi:hypothetical protein
MHAVKLKFLGFNTPYVIAASKPNFLSSHAALKVENFDLIFLEIQK